MTVECDGNSLAYRYNSVLFSDAVSLSGSLTGNGAGGSLQGTISIPANDPLNPYRHRYHPEHNVGYDITREIEMNFAADDPEVGSHDTGLSQTAGDNQLVGTYTETISGISLEPIVVQGTFRLFRLTNGSH